MDLHSNIKVSRAIAPVAAITDNTPWVSAILDTQNYDTNELVLLAGSLADADATFTTLLEESNDSGMSGANAVADADLIGLESEASFTFADDNVTKKLGYKGGKRYIRATVTPANNTGSAFMAGLWIQANGRKTPAA